MQAALLGSRSITQLQHLPTPPTEPLHQLRRATSDTCFAAIRRTLLTMDTFIPLPALAVLILASYRATQLLVHDSLLDPLRARFAIYGADHPGKVHDFFSTLWQCIYCAGYWLSGLTLLTYLLVTGAAWGNGAWLIHGVEWFAVAGGQALLNRRDDTF